MFKPATLPELAERFDAFLIDQFGVLLDGTGAYPFAPAALAALAKTGKAIMLLSNSGKRGYLNEARLEKLGFQRESFEKVLSSGEAVHQVITENHVGNPTCNTRIFVISRDGDTSFLEGASVQIVSEPERADLIIIAGSEAEHNSLEDYRALLSSAAITDIPCWCTNPDKHMLAGNEILFGAGAIADAYVAMGGRVEWFGKPYPLIYEMALAEMANIPPNRVLCIGDSLEHDIAGGAKAGCATALVRTGIHLAENEADLRQLSATHGAEPDFVLERFEW